MFWYVLTVGVTVGAIYTLVTIGYSMVYGMLKLMNFAHGDVYIFGTLLSYTLLTSYHVPPIWAVLAGAVIGGALASLVEVVAYRKLRSAQHRMISMITALGAAFVIQNISELHWGDQVLPYPSIFPAYQLSFLNGAVSLTNLVTLGTAIAVIVAFNLFLKYHKMGKAILCVSEDIATSSLMGIPINSTISVVYFLGGLLGVIGGVLYSTSYNVISLMMGFHGTIIAFTAAVVGGIGSLEGAMIGGMIIGLSENFVGVYISSAFRDPIMFLLLILILLVKPTGIMGKAEEKKV